MNRNTCQNMTSFSRNRQGIETSPSGFRTGQPAFQIRQEHAEPDLSSVPTGNQKRLFCYINEISFAVYETLLFLDTHPFDQDALQYFRTCSALRNYALEEYAKAYGPLTIDTANDAQSRSWQWMAQPWPWEGGMA